MRWRVSSHYISQYVSNTIAPNESRKIFLRVILLYQVRDGNRSVEILRRGGEAGGKTKGVHFRTSNPTEPVPISNRFYF